jgi:hypothetical protein
VAQLLQRELQDDVLLRRRVRQRKRAEASHRIAHVDGRGDFALVDGRGRRLLDDDDRLFLLLLLLLLFFFMLAIIIDDGMRALVLLLMVSVPTPAKELREHAALLGHCRHRRHQQSFK